MPRKATGSYYKSGDLWYASVTLRPGSKGRKSIPLPVAKNEDDAKARAELVNELAQKLRAAKLVDDAEHLLIEVGCRQGKALDRVVRAIEGLCRGELTPKRAALADATFKDIAEMWMSGELAREHKGYVKMKKTWHAERSYFKNHIFTIIGHVPIREFVDERGLELGENVMKALPATMGNGRVQIARTVQRVLNLAVYPLKILKHNPLPKGFVPKQAPQKAKGCVYPDEDAQLLGCTEIWVGSRLYDGFQHREGMRGDEAKRLTFADFDFLHGGVKLDKNKTDNPRDWATRRGVTPCIAAFRLLREEKEGPLPDDALVFVDEKRKPIGRGDACRYREDLMRAGVTRAVLFQHDEARQQVRAHDKRAAFVTVALANDRTESWAQDRTGHSDSRMICKYRRRARTFREMRLGDWRPIDQLIPDLAPYLAKLPREIREPTAQTEHDAPKPETQTAEHDAGRSASDPARPYAVALVGQLAAGHGGREGIVAGIVATAPFVALVPLPVGAAFMNGFEVLTPHVLPPTISPSVSLAS